MSSSLRAGIVTLSFVLSAVTIPALAQQSQTSGVPSIGFAGLPSTTSDLMQQERVHQMLTSGIVGAPKIKPLMRPNRNKVPQSPGFVPPEEKAFAAAARKPGLKAQSLSTSFLGATLADTSAFPPDSMGAVGPTQFLVGVNGRLRTFNKTTGVADGVLNLNTDTFFASVMTPLGGGITFNFTSDPRVRYDRLSGRWIIEIIDVPMTIATGFTFANRSLLAVSDAASAGVISGATVWTLYFFQPSATSFADYCTMGIDINALYIGCDMFATGIGGAFINTNAYVVRKSSILSGGPITVTTFADLLGGTGAGPLTPQGVDNYDPLATEGYFIGVDGAAFSLLQVRRISSPGSASPTISANIPIAVATTGFPKTVPHLGNTGGTNGNLDAIDDRLFAAHMRNGRLWTAHNISVTFTGVANSGVNGRDAARWYELQGLNTATPTVFQTGTVFDASNPVSGAQWFWIPTVMVSGQGHAAMGFSRAGASFHADAYFTGRLASDALGTMPGPLTAITASTFAYNPPSDPGGASGRRWGDFSFTSLDPLDDMTMWTIQEFTNATNSYGVQAAKLLAPPPASPTTAVPASVAAGQASVNVVITGTSAAGSGFFDPGPNLSAPALPFNHIAAAVSGSVIVNSVTYTDPTHITLNISTVGAPLGAKNVNVTNPDGQTSATGVGLITVTGSPATHFSVSAPASATAGSAFSFTVTALDASNATATGYAGIVHFTSSDGAAVLPADATLTNGVGTFSATLDTAGNQTITATDTVTGSITGTSNTIAVSAGAASSMTANAGTTPQSATINTAFANALAVTVKDAFNNPVSGVNVTFTAPGAGASGLFSNLTTTITVATNASGIAAAPFTANATAGGPYTVTAASAGLTTVNFSLTNTVGAATSMTANAGTTPQSATINTAFANALAVTVRDAGNNPVSGVNVTFTAPGAGASGLFSNLTTTITVATNASGIAAAPFTANATAGGPYTVTAASAGLTTVNFSLTNTAGAATSMTANAGTTPQSATINTAFANALAVTVRDAGNNPVSGVNVTFTAPGAGASGLFSNLTTTITVATNASGIAAAPFTANATAGGPYTVTAASAGLTTVNFSLTNTAGAATSMTANAGTTPQSATINTAFANALAVTVRDAGNNPVSGVNVTFTAPGAGASGLFSNLTTTITVATNASGIAAAPFTANGTAGGPYTVTAASAGLTTVNFSLTNTAGAATHFSVSAPASATAGVAFSFTVTALDASNATATGYSGTVHFTSSDGQAILPANATLTNGVGTFSATLKTAGNQTITATDTVTASITGTSNTIAVSAAAATHFTVSAPASATAGTAFSFTVTALDAFNNTATGYAGTVHFTSTDGAAVLPANSTLTNGVGTFSATLKTAGNQTITATDTVTASITGTSNTIAVSAAAATHFTVSAPASATAGTAFSFTVTALDAFNNTATGYAGTVHFTSSDGAAVLPANSTLVSGIGTFSATLKTVGSQTITATDTVTASITGTSNTITVSAAAATHFAVSAPASATAGTAFSFTVTALDAFNNTATGYAGTVHFTSTDGAAVLPANSTLTNGVGTFSATLKTAGNQTITATDTVTASITGTSNTIAVSAAAATHFTVSAPASATSGVAFSFTVTAQDQFNNTATSYAGTVHFTSTDGAAVLPANSTLTNGVGTFSATLNTAGSRTITATDTVTASITGTSNAIVVSGAGVATHFSVSAPASATAGTAFSFTVTALDASNATATGYSGTVHFTSSDGLAVLPADATLVSGVGTFSATLKTAGNQTITATDTITASITGTSNTIAVSAAAATHFTVSAPASATSGVAFSFTVTAQDQFNNTAASYAGTVHFTSSDGAAVLPANSTLTNGVGTFSATLNTAGSRTITATDTVTASITGTSNAIVVSGAGVATHFSVSAPASATAGVAFSFTVTALDASNATATGYSGTVHFTSSDGLAVLPADATLVSGVGTFSATLKTAGNQTITATDTVTASITGTSNTIAVSAAAATHFSVSAPGSATAGTAFSFTITAKDQFNNTNTAYAGTVHFTSSDGAAILPANSTLTNGVGTFSATLNTTGSQTITATDTVTASIVGNVAVVVSAAGAVTVAGIPTQSEAVLAAMSVMVLLLGLAVLGRRRGARAKRMH